METVTRVSEEAIEVNNAYIDECAYCEPIEVRNVRYYDNTFSNLSTSSLSSTSVMGTRENG